MENKENFVTLETPVMRDEQVINSVEVIKPNSGALRGTRLADLAGSDVDALLDDIKAATPVITSVKTLIAAALSKRMKA